MATEEVFDELGDNLKAFNLMMKRHGFTNQEALYLTGQWLRSVVNRQASDAARWTPEDENA
jgi:hypothetical protein